MGVKELFLYDPTGEYLDPPLIGLRLQSDGPSLMRPDWGALECRELGLLLRLEFDRLAIFDAKSGTRLLSEAEAAEANTSRFGSTSSQGAGTLRINSRPWSEVYLDGRLIGNTPQMSVRVPAGRYTLRLSNPELGMSKTMIVQVAAGELVQVEQ